MKAEVLPAIRRTPTHRNAALLACAVALALGQQQATMAATQIDLGTAGDFAVLAGSGITITGPTTITGDIGTFPTPSITGLANLTLIGMNHGGDAVTQLAKDDLVTAYNIAAGLAYDVTYGAAHDLGGSILLPGVYNGISSLFLTGTLTLDAQGDPDAVWIFQTGSTLITASDSTVKMIGGAQACHVFWQVGTSATLGVTSDFAGNILALTSATLNTGATVDGRVLARNGAVTLQENTITEAICVASPVDIPEAGTTTGLLALGAGVALFLKFRRSQAAVA